MDLAQDFSLSNALGTDNLLSLRVELPLEVDIMEAQNLFFHLMEQHFNKLVCCRPASPAGLQGIL